MASSALQATACKLPRRLDASRVFPSLFLATMYAHSSGVSDPTVPRQCRQCGGCKTDRRQLARLRKDAAGLGWDDELAGLGLANLQRSAHVWCRSVVLCVCVWAWRGISSNTHNARLAKALHSLLVAEQAACNFTGVHIRQCIVLRDAPLQFPQTKVRLSSTPKGGSHICSTHRSQSVHCGWLYRHLGCPCWVRHVAHFTSL